MGVRHDKAKQRKDDWEAEELRGFALARANQTGACPIVRFVCGCVFWLRDRHPLSCARPSLHECMFAYVRVQIGAVVDLASMHRHNLDRGDEDVCMHGCLLYLWFCWWASGYRRV